MIITKIQLRWNDFDTLRHVYNGQYQQFFDIGKSEYFLQVMGVSHDWSLNGEGLITASTYTNFYSPVEIDERIEVQTKVEKIGNKSFTVFQEIRNSVTDELKSDSRTVLVGYNPTTKTTFEIPQKWRDAMDKEGENISK